MNALRAFYARWGNSLREFVTFGTIGGAGVLVNLLTIFVAHNVAYHAFGAADSLAVWNIPATRYSVRLYHVYALLAFGVANLFNFVLNRYWTFRHEARAPFWKEFLPFLMVGLVAQGIGLLILTLLRNPTSPFFLPDPWFTENGAFWTKRLYWAQLIQVVLVMPINFVVNKLWTFRAVRRRHAASVGS